MPSSPSRAERSRDPVARTLLAIVLVLQLLSLAVLGGFVWAGLQVRAQVEELRGQVETALTQVDDVTSDLRGRLGEVDEAISSLRNFDLGSFLGR